MRNRKNRKRAGVFFLAGMLAAASVPTMVCANEAEEEIVDTQEEIVDTQEESTFSAPEIPGLTYESRMDLNYADCFEVYYYSDGYKVIDVLGSAQYLLVPEGKEVPKETKDMKVLCQPLDQIYMAATSPMALFDAMDGIDSVRFSGLDAASWSVQAAADALDAGEMTFAGKYDEPDYELLLAEGCDLAIESTMILHSPKVQEMLEMLEIPVFIDRSSYEKHPLGRTEWIRAYGAMLNKEEEAQDFFDGQAKVIDDLKDFTNTEKKIAFFYINTAGSPVVRNPKDYISSMIELAGGRNAFADLADDSGKSSVAITMEEFFDTAADADYLIYNSSIDSSVTTLDGLLAKDEILKEFKAVKEGNVWVTSPSMYQATDTIGQLIVDIHRMLTGDGEEQMHFLSKLA